MELTATALVEELRAQAQPAEHPQKHYHGTGGVLGARMRTTFDIAKRFTELPLTEVDRLQRPALRPSRSSLPRSAGGTWAEGIPLPGAAFIPTVMTMFRADSAAYLSALGLTGAPAWAASVDSALFTGARSRPSSC